MAKPKTKFSKPIIPQREFGVFNIVTKNRKRLYKEELFATTKYPTEAQQTATGIYNFLVFSSLEFGHQVWVLQSEPTTEPIYNLSVTLENTNRSVTVEGLSRPMILGLAGELLQLGITNLSFS